MSWHHATSIWLSGNQKVYLLRRFVSGWNWFNLHLGSHHRDPFSGRFFPPGFLTQLFDFFVQIILISRRTQSWKAFMLWERSISGAVDLWNSLFLYSLAINLRMDLIPFSTSSIRNFFSRKVKNCLKKGPELDYSLSIINKTFLLCQPCRRRPNMIIFVRGEKKKKVRKEVYNRFQWCLSFWINEGLMRGKMIIGDEK